MLRPKRLKWEEFKHAWIATCPITRKLYWVSKIVAIQTLGYKTIAKEECPLNGMEACQSHYDAAWLSGGEEVAE